MQSIQQDGDSSGNFLSTKLDGRYVNLYSGTWEITGDGLGITKGWYGAERSSLSAWVWGGNQKNVEIICRNRDSFFGYGLGDGYYGSYCGEKREDTSSRAALVFGDKL